MADQRVSDMVMRFVQDTRAVYAESTLDKDPHDTLMRDFRSATYQEFSDFFEVTRFSFGVEVKDEDQTKSDVSEESDEPKTKIPARFNASAAKLRGAYVSWRSASDDEVRRKKIPMPLEFETFSFSKLVDSASPIFFDACLRSQTFKQATLVKRTSVGMDQHPLGFLRMDFYNVLIIGMDWDDGGMVSESCKFLCRRFELKYARQNSDGSLQPAVGVDWDPARDGLPELVK